MSSSKPPPLSTIRPCWPGVQVEVTETGFNPSEPGVQGFGFNLGTHVGDDRSEVEVRRGIVQKIMGANIVWLNQVHGCDVIDLAALPHAVDRQGAPTADALVSCSTDSALAIMTADCLPVVFVAYDHRGRALGVGAAHAGWKGLVGGVLQNTAQALVGAAGCSPAQVKAWLGPSIAQHSFEVGPEVREAFVEQNPANSACFIEGDRPGKHLADLYGLARLALASAGVTSVEGGGLDTFTDLRWFSHRRGQQQQRPSGRFATLIRLLPQPVA